LRSEHAKNAINLQKHEEEPRGQDHSSAQVLIPTHKFEVRTAKASPATDTGTGDNFTSKEKRNDRVADAKSPTLSPQLVEKLDDLKTITQTSGNMQTLQPKSPTTMVQPKRSTQSLSPITNPQQVRPPKMSIVD